MYASWAEADVYAPIREFVPKGALSQVKRPSILQSETSENSYRRTFAKDATSS
jgi:hypothetical protein